MLETALAQAVAAVAGKKAYDDLARYYDRSGSYAGTLFTDAAPNVPDSIEAADLYAVTTLSMVLDARHGRLLLDEGRIRAGVRSQLQKLCSTLAITDLEGRRGWRSGDFGAHVRASRALP